MIRPDRSVRGAAALAGAVGVLALAGCGPAATDAEAPVSGSAGTGTDYADGTYAASGSYQTPESVEQVEVTIALEDGVITAVDVTGEPSRRESEEYQGRFIGGIADEVVGRRIDEISVSRVAGSSLTSGGFNQALEEIRAEASR